jgi:hypothetical protein
MAIKQPTDITGCVVWLDPGTISATDGDPIGTWSDQSGSANDATASGVDRPTYRDGTAFDHGQPTLEFSDVGHRIEAAADASLDNAQVTYAVVCRLEDLDANTDPAWLINKVNTNASTVGMRIADSDIANKGLYEIFYRLDGTEGTVRTIPSRGPYRESWTVFLFRFDGTDGEMYIDKDLAGSLTLSGSIDADNSGKLTIGNHNSSDLGWRGHIGEVVVYDNSISDVDRDDLIDWLLAKYRNSEYRKESTILSSGIRHARIKTASETGQSDHQMIVVTTAGAINHYTAPTTDPHNWTLQNSSIIATNASYRTLDFVVVSGTWYVYVDKATSNGELRLWTGAAVTSLTEHGSSPLITGSVGDYNRVPAVIEESGSWTMLIDVRTDALLGGDGHVDRWTASDGISWTKDTTNSPVISSLSTGFEGTDITHPMIYKRGTGDYLIVYAGYNDLHPLDATHFPHEIGLVTSTNLSTNWVRSKKNPILTMGQASGTFDLTLVANPCLFHDGKHLTLYYSGRETGGGIQLGYATSAAAYRPRKEQWKNGGSTTLDGAIGSGDTTLTVDDTSSFPTEGDFRVKIGSEIILVTHVSDLQWTIERGADGTAAAAHSDAATVAHYMTGDSIARAAHDALFLPAEDRWPLNRVQRDDTQVTLTASSFTWLNQGTATCVDADDGGLLMTMPSEAVTQVRGKYLTAPSTPWWIVAFVMYGPGMAIGASGSSLGLMGRENSTGKLYLLPQRQDIGGALWRMTNVTTFSADVDTFIDGQQQGVWMRLGDNGTNVFGEMSQNGIDWEVCWDEGRTSFMSGGIDQIGFFAQSGSGAAGAEFYFKSWILSDSATP